MYGLTEKQFASYVEKALESKVNPQAALFWLPREQVGMPVWHTEWDLHHAPYGKTDGFAWPPSRERQTRHRSLL